MASPSRPDRHKILWFLALWLGGVGVLGVFAFTLRGILKLAGG